MTRRIAPLLSVAMLLVAFSVPLGAQQEPIEVLRTRAEAGDASAQSNLGIRYANGQGVPEDDVEAVRWYRLASHNTWTRSLQTITKWGSKWGSNSRCARISVS